MALTTIPRVGTSAAGIFLSVFAFASSKALAQGDGAPLGEVAGFAGVAFGADARPTPGGSAAAYLSRYAMLQFETSFIPLGQHTIQPWPARPEVSRSHLYSFAIDLHIRIPVRERWEPYVIVGTPLLWDTFLQSTVGPHGVPVVYHRNQLNGGFDTGGGVRYYIGRKWGIRPEFKVIASQSTYTRLSIGVFYVTSGEIP